MYRFNPDYQLVPKNMVEFLKKFVRLCLTANTNKDLQGHGHNAYFTIYNGDYDYGDKQRWDEKQGRYVPVKGAWSKGEWLNLLTPFLDEKRIQHVKKMAQRVKQRLGPDDQTYWHPVRSIRFYATSVVVNFDAFRGTEQERVALFGYNESPHNTVFGGFGCSQSYQYEDMWTSERSNPNIYSKTEYLLAHEWCAKHAFDRGNFELPPVPVELWNTLESCQQFHKTAYNNFVGSTLSDVLKVNGDMVRAISHGCQGSIGIRLWGANDMVRAISHGCQGSIGIRLWGANDMLPHAFRIEGVDSLAADDIIYTPRGTPSCWLWWD